MPASIPFPTLRSDRWERAIDRLDSQRDAHRIATILVNHVFPVDAFVSVELAQLRTFTIPSISGLLHATGQYERAGTKRLDDTKAILSEILQPGPDSVEGREMVDHLNRIHGLYDISNDDFLFTLSTFVFDPLVWNRRYGWRPVRPHEQQATFALYRRLGEHMGIEAIPASLADFGAWRDAYEEAHQRFAPSNLAVARGLLGAIASQLPAPLGALVEPTVCALIVEDRFVEALGLRRPEPWFVAAVQHAMGLRRRLGRRWTLWERARFWDTRFFRHYSTYPDGYQRMRLGPDKVIRLLDPRRQADPVRTTTRGSSG